MTKGRWTRSLAATLACGLAACGDSGTSPEPLQAPTIDGVRGVDEWENATVLTTTRELVAGSGPSTILVMTDGTDLFIALEIQDQAEVNDTFAVRFDNDNDDVRTDGDDWISLSPPSDFSDGHYIAETEQYSGPDVSEDGRGMVGQDGAVAFYEMSHPLRTGDPDDIAIGVGDTVGMCFRYYNAGATNSGWPSGCVLSVNEQLEYIDVTVGSR